MRRAAKTVLLTALGILVVALSVANRQAVTLSLDPFRPDDPALSLDLPLFGALFLAAAIGVLVGGTAAWLGQSKWRKVARTSQAEADEMRRRDADRRRDLARATGPALPAPAER